MMGKMMGICCPLLLMVCAHLVLRTHGLPQGHAPRYIVDLMCPDINGIVSLPWDCEGYLYCTSTGQMTQGWWFRCVEGLYFDGSLPVPSCVRSNGSCSVAKDVAAELCPRFPSLRFPHPASCAMFYNCSQTSPLKHHNLHIYEDECPHPFLFDPELPQGQCRTDQLRPKECKNVPRSKADYRKGSLEESQLCKGLPNGFHPQPYLPVFSPEYIQCEGGALVASQKCFLDRVFDPVSAACVIDITPSLIAYCAANPSAVFPDRGTCAGYYNCSQTTSPFRNNRYQNECPYAYLFDTVWKQCVKFDAMSSACGDRPEPINPCEYRIGQCMGRQHCIPCVAQCKKKTDGPHPFPGLLDTRFHMICKSGRTVEILECRGREIYNQVQRICLSEDPQVLPTTSTTASPPTQPPPRLTQPPPNPTDPPTPPAPPIPGPPAELGECQCLDRIEPLANSMKNLSTVLDEMSKKLQGTNSASCENLPIYPNSYVEVRHEGGVVKAMYTCHEGYAHCTSDTTAVCGDDNTWTPSSVTCHKTTFTHMNYVHLVCSFVEKGAIVLRGRAVRNSFSVRLTEGGRSYVFLQVDPVSPVPVIKAGTVPENAVQIDWNNPIYGENVWIIYHVKDELKVTLNGYHVKTMKLETPLEEGGLTLDVTDGFHVEDIKLYPMDYSDIELFGKSQRMVNLALHKPVRTSESGPGSKLESLTDGLHLNLVSKGTCWGPTPDGDAWLRIDLGRLVYVSHLFLTTVACEKEPCALYSINTVILVENELLSGDVKCADYKEQVSPGDIIRIDCDIYVIGHHVSLSSSNLDYFEFCEVEVYGGVLTNPDLSTAWTPFSCQEPPLMKASSVSLSYTQTEAVATYTCEGSGVTCSGSNVIRCSDQSGWDGTPERCIPITVISKTNTDDAAGIITSKIEFCRLSLGSTIEILLEAESPENSEVTLHSDEKTILKMELTNGVFSLAPPPSLEPLENELPDQTQHTVVFHALTDHFLIDVNGEKLAQYAISEIPQLHKIYYMVAVGVKFQAFTSEPTRERMDVNLAADFAKGSCMRIGNPPEGKPSIVVMLDKQYFIREVKIDLRQREGTDKDNIALKATVTDASPGRDAMSSAESVTDGNLDNDKNVMGSCYTSASAEEPFMVLDLGEVKTVKSVAIQLPEISQYSDQFTGLNIGISATDPTLGNAEKLVCIQLDGTESSSSYARFPCQDPAPSGRFVEIRKGSEGNEKSMLSLCEVEVYSVLETKLHDFTINVYEEIIPVKSEPKFCYKHVGDLSKDAIHGLQCTDDGVWGRYVEIEAEIMTDKLDYMGVCNVEVYGDKAVKAAKGGWSPSDCPSPPPHPDSAVTVSMTPSQAVAHYQCLDGYSTCSGKPNTLVCDSATGWTDMPRTCNPRTRTMEQVQTTKLGGVTNLCPLKVGEAMRITFVTEDQRMELRLTAGEARRDIVWQDDMKVLTVTPDGESSSAFTVEHKPYVSQQEIQVVVTLLSFNYHFEVNGKEFYVDFSTYDHISDVMGGLWLKLSHMYLTYSEETLNGVMRVPYKERLLRKSLVTASSQGTDVPVPPEVVIDGDLRPDEADGSCWRSSIADSSPWWRLDMGFIAYVTHVLVTTSSWRGETSDFKIEMFYNTPESEGGEGELCLQYEGPLPQESTTNLTCTQVVHGRILQVSAPDRGMVFSMCELRAFGGIVVKSDGGPRNLALHRPTRPSTSKDTHLAVDGNEAVKPSSNSCWMTLDGRWWEVDLGDIYYITSVEITSFGCECEYGLHDFDIRVYETNSEASGLCLHYSGEFPQSSKEVLPCKEKRPGRVVRVEGPEPGDGAEEVFGLCEVAVFGEEKLNDWTVRDCPQPPTTKDARVQLSHTSDKAFAEYTCLDGYTMCSGAAMLECSDQSGWQGNPGKCILTTIHTEQGAINNNICKLDDNIVFKPQTSFPLCPLKLGEGVEVNIIADVSDMKFMGDYGVPLQIQIGEEKVYLNAVTPTLQDRITLGQMTVISVLFLTHTFLILVDGSFYSFSVHHGESFHISELKFGSSHMFRGLRPLGRYHAGVIRRPVMKNLAVGKIATASSQRVEGGSTDVQYPIDGDLSLDQFWHPKPGSSWAQWYQIDLGGYYFVREVNIFTRDVTKCGTCAGRTHSVAIDVMPAEDPDQSALRCAFYNGVMKDGEETRVVCKKDIWGRYVRLSRSEEDTQDANDLLTFAEVEVYGDEVVLPTICRMELGYTMNADTCYHLGSIKLTQQAASVRCQMDGGRLMVIDTKEKYEYWVVGITDHLWVGMTRKKGAFVWSNGESLVEKWVDEAGPGDCVVSTPKGLSPQNCEDTYFYMCEIPLPDSDTRITATKPTEPTQPNEPVEGHP